MSTSYNNREDILYPHVKAIEKFCLNEYILSAHFIWHVWDVGQISTNFAVKQIIASGLNTSPLWVWQALQGSTHHETCFLLFLAHWLNYCKLIMLLLNMAILNIEYFLLESYMYKFVLERHFDISCINFIVMGFLTLNWAWHLGLYLQFYRSNMINLVCRLFCVFYILARVFCCRQCIFFIAR